MGFKALETMDKENRRVGWLVFCPACGCGHQFNDAAHPASPQGARWTMSGTLQCPTFSPSMLVRYPRGHTAPETYQRIPHLGQRERVGDESWYDTMPVLWKHPPGSGVLPNHGIRIPLELVGNDRSVPFTLEAICAKIGIVATFDALDDRVRQWREAKFPPYVCHSFVRNGRIEYLGDCTHHLKGQTVDLPDMDD